MTYVIGDIHGEITKLIQLIRNIKVRDNQPKFIFLGDYINKGENSKKVLEYLRKFRDSIFLMGNHEYYLLEYIKNNNYKDKLELYACDSTFSDFDVNFENLYEKIYIPYKDFFENLITFYEIDDFIISHAGINPKYKDEKLQDIPKEEFLFNRYNFITYEDKIKNRIIIFGHTGFNYPYYDGYKIGIDTAAVYSEVNPLTAFCLEKRLFINSLNEIQYLADFKLDRTSWINRKEPYRKKKANNE